MDEIKDINFEADRSYALILHHDLELTKEILEEIPQNTTVTVYWKRQLPDLHLRTYFIYDAATYEWIQGTSMGSTISEFLAEILMHVHEDIELTKSGSPYMLTTLLLLSHFSISRNCKQSSTLFNLFPYIKNVPAMTIRLPHKSTKIMHRLILNCKEKSKTVDRRGVIYNVECQDGYKCYIDQTGRNLAHN